MKIEPIPCLSDNYAYLIVDETTNVCAVVDPSEPAPVLAALARVSLPLAALLCTHHHGDHVGGVRDVLDAHPGARVYGHRSDEARIPMLTDRLDDGDTFSVGKLSVTTRHVPGHTLGAVTYVVRDPGDGDAPPWAFTGDTLFLAGCGRLFEGTAEQMHRSLSHVLARLPPETRIGCGHEYTAANLRFAKHVEPDHRPIARRIEQVTAMRGAGKPTVPGTLADELETNPFLRVEEPSVRAHVKLGLNADPVEVLARLRKEKDSF